MVIRVGVLGRTLAAIGLAAVVVALWFALSSGGIGSASGGAPSASEGPFAENFTFSDPPVPAPSEPFQALDGASVSLTDFRGRLVLVNFWATWCAPCVEEMPSLERLHQALADEGLAVLAVSQDRGGAGTVRPFLERLDLRRLPVYLDPKGGLGRAFSLKGLPTTVLVDRGGQVVGRLVGPAEWDSREAKAFIRRYLEQDSSVRHTSG